ncbi:MAG: hypothetical protein AB9856_01525 [Cellulosilyticaceae bacterium]
MIPKLLYDMLPLLLFCLGILCIFFTFAWKVKKTVHKHQKGWDAYLEEERAASFVRKKSIPTDLLLTVELDKIPSVTNLECQSIYEKLGRFKNVPLCTLPNLSNLELKQQYGYQGFQQLVQYEQSYGVFMDLLIQYALLLKETDYLNEAMATLEYATTMQCYKSTCYLTLIEIYGIMENRIKLEGLQNFITDNMAHSIYYKEIQRNLTKSLEKLTQKAL